MSLPKDAGHVRVIAGEYDGSKGSARTFTPINLWDVSLASGSTVTFPLPDGNTSAFLVLRGEVTINGDSEAGAGDLAVFARSGASVVVNAHANSSLLVMSGEPIGEPIVAAGPFVMNSRAEIDKAMEDFRMGRMGVIA